MPTKAPRPSTRNNPVARKIASNILRELRKTLRQGNTIHANEYAGVLHRFGYPKMSLVNRWAAACAPFGSI